MQVAALQFDVAWMDRAANWQTMDRLLGSANLAPGTSLGEALDALYALKRLRPEG